ncbi:MAG TPA: SDR family NAD(P)-dependent oxidoreductase [Ruminiclostridium sp.]|nr:SDR family NAD(P)-dependent oxidoreductase [Ruminiclostridium sp.]
MLEFNSLKLDKSGLQQNVKEISAKDIAVIGISLKMPKAENKDEFWNNLKLGADCIGEFSGQRKKDADAYLKFCGWDIDKVKYFDGAYLKDIDKFDYSFFNIPPKEASLISPVQRLFLEAAWKTVEDAGYGGKIEGSRTGVYVGYEADVPYDYKRIISDVDIASMSVSVTGNLTPIIASRISYLLNLKGPSMSIDTACSSSLLAVHTACRAIRNGECDLAIAGSVRINLLPIDGQLDFGISSSDGRTKTFDDSSDGTGSGEGVAAVLLKPYNRAVSDRDNIYAVIKGTYANQDGKSIGLTAPNVQAQEDVITNAWKDADVAPETISYIEAHGTGTKLGDPIEIEGIKRAFRRYTSKKQFCAVGSVKTNLGHLDNAAGMAGLIKAILSLYHRQLPPSLHFKKPNRKIDFIESPVYVNNKLLSWETDGIPRRCGVSSFGFSGTNCHVVLEEADKGDDASPRPTTGLQIITLSAKSIESLNDIVREYIEFLKGGHEALLEDICYTANTGRWRYKHRLAVIARDNKDLLEKLRKVVSEGFAKSDNDKIYYSDIDEQAGGFTGNLEYPASESSLRELCRAYISGLEIDWNRLYSKQNRRRVSLPTYVFEKKRCWIDIPEDEARSIAHETHYYYKTVWEGKEIEHIHSGRSYGTVVVFKYNSENGNKLVDCLQNEYQKVIEVNIGEEYNRISPYRYQIRAAQEDYERFFSEIRGEKVSHVIHMLTAYNNESLQSSDTADSESDNGLYGLFGFLKSLGEVQSPGIKNFTMITSYANEVTGDEERIIPENTAMIGMSHAIKWENTQINFKLIDIDHLTDILHIHEELVSQNSESYVAYRNDKRYIKLLERADIAASKDIGTELKGEGVYIITGGTGGIAGHICRYISSQKKVNFALISRSGLSNSRRPGNEAENERDSKASAGAEAVEEITASGSSVEICMADVSRMKEMKKVIDVLRIKYGRINGVIHCAGAGNGNLIKLQNKSEFGSIISSKMAGTRILDTLTAKDKLDFFVLISSAITLIGGIGSGAYTAANSYLDAYSVFMRKAGRPALTINWPAWRETGLAAGLEINEEKEVFKIIAPDLAVKAFGEVIKKDISQVFIGELNNKSTVFGLKDFLPFKLSQNLITKIEQPNKKTKASHQKKLMKVKLKGRESEEYTQIEMQVAGIWREVLGFEEIDINSNFFDMGGDSLLLTRVHSMVDELYPGLIKISDLFAFPTISKLSQNIASMIAGNDSDQDNEQLFVNEINNIIEDLQSGILTVEDAVNKYDLLEVNR